MNKSLAIALACLLSLFMQYFADIASIMTTVLLFPSVGNEYIHSCIIATVSVAVSYALVRFCAFKWFHLDFHKLNLFASNSWVKGLICGAIFFGALFLYALFLQVKIDTLPPASWLTSLFDALVNKGIGTAIGEELIFRGFLFGLILKLTDFAKAAIISVIVFVIPHMFVFDLSILSLLIFINYVATSLLLTALYYNTRSLMAPITYHALYNFILYGIWNVIGTGETSTAIFTQEYNSSQMVGYIITSAIIQFTISYLLLRDSKNKILLSDKTF